MAVCLVLVRRFCIQSTPPKMPWHAKPLYHYEKWLERKYPRVYKVHRNVIDGSKVCYTDLKIYFRVAYQLRSGSGKQLQDFTRKELEVYLLTPPDLMRILSVLFFFFCLPPPSAELYTVFLVFFPRLLLTRHFWTLDQTEKFRSIVLEKRRRHHYGKIADALITELKKNETSPGGIMAQFQEEVKNQSISLNSLNNYGDLIGQVKIDNLPSIYQFHLARAHGIWSRFSSGPANLHGRARLLAELDSRLRSENVDTMPLMDLKQSLYIRQFDILTLSDDEERQLLKDWLSLTSKHRSDALILHASVLSQLHLDKQKQLESKMACRILMRHYCTQRPSPSRLWTAIFKPYQRFEQWLMVHHPKAFRFHRLMIDGTRDCFVDVKVSLQVYSGLKRDKSFKDFSRAQLETYMLTRQEFLKLLVFGLFFIPPPPISEFYSLIQLYFPRLLLTRHFWTAQQTEKFRYLLLKERRRYYYAKITDAFLDEMKMFVKSEDKKIFEHFCQALKNRSLTLEQLTNYCYLISLINIDLVPATLQYDLARTHGVWSLFKPAPVILKRLAELLNTLDTKIRTENIDDMSILDVQQSLYIRQFDIVKMSDEQQRRLLKQWVSLTSRCTSDTLVLFAPILVQLYMLDAKK